MGTIRIKNLSTRNDFAVMTAIAYLMLEGEEAFRREFGEDINIRKRGDTYTVTDVEEQKSTMPGNPDTAQE